MDSIHASQTVRQSICSKGFWTAPRCYRCSACFIFIGLLTLVLLCIFVVSPAIDGLSLKPATCIVLRSEVSGTQSCRCGKGCSSSYPCLKIFVEYIPKDFHERNMSNVLLHDTVYEDNVESECSVAPCKNNKNANKEKVKEFQDKLGKEGQQYLCYYNEKKPDEVVTKTGDFKAAIVHSILWPTLLILAMIGVIAGVYIHQKKSIAESFTY